MTSTKSHSRFTKFLGALACAAALAPGLAGAQDVRHANRFDDRFDNDRFIDENDGTPGYAGDAFRFRGPRFEDPEIAALRARLERIESRIEEKEEFNEQLADTLADANRELRIATAQHRTARARFINSLGSRRQASAFRTYLASSQRLMAASTSRARAVSDYNDSMAELARMESHRDRVQAALDEKLEARRVVLRPGHGRGGRPVMVTVPTGTMPAGTPSTVMVQRDGNGGFVVTPVGYPGN